MQNEQYYFPNRVVKQMNIPFTIKLATKDPDVVVMEQLKIVTGQINERLHRIDLDFSPFRDDSLVSRYQRGDQSPLLESTDFQSIYAQTVLAEQMTDSIFTPYFAGHFDPTGLVKGWAIEQAFDQYLKPLLEDPKIEAVSLNGGGDMKLATRQGSDFHWGIGIENPDDLSQIIATYYLKNGAVATSGNSKRGEHIIRMHENAVEQVTVISNSLVDADVWATVGISAGIDKFSTMINEYNLSGLLIDETRKSLNFSEGAIANAQETPL